MWSKFGAASLLLALPSCGTAKEPFDELTEEGRAAAFFQSELGKSLGRTQGAHLMLTFSDLNGDKTPEAIDYVFGPDVCGNGGCNAYVLQRSGETYRVVTRTTVTWPPIRRLASMTNGWRDIGVWVAGGGVGQGYEAVLTFDGTSYPSNPSTVGRRGGRPEGDTLIQMLWLPPSS